MNKKHIHKGGCLSCRGTEDLLSLDTILYNDFGGYTVYRNKKCFYQANQDTPEKKIWKMSRVEKYASMSPEDRWEVEVYLPLRGATWKRDKKGNWKLTKTNLGFA